jgi:hypothetical protein
MKSGRTLQSLALELERQREVKRDYLAPTVEMRMTAEGELVVGTVDTLRNRR